MRTTLAQHSLVRGMYTEDYSLSMRIPSSSHYTELIKLSR